MGAPSAGARPVVTIAGLYGAGGSVISAEVAARLGVPLYDRSLRQYVAQRSGLSEDAVADADEEPRSPLDRITSSLGRATTMSGALGGSTEGLDLQMRELRGRFEEALARTLTTGGVAVGRGGMVVLAGVPAALHVLLQAPPDARVARGMEIDGVDRPTALARQKEQDRARRRYVRRVYGVDGDDPSLYHLVLDTSEISTHACVEIILAASADRLHRLHRIPGVAQGARG